jgi:hypothetical protein
MKKLAIPLAVIAVSTVVALLAFEILLRAIGFSAPVWREPHPQLGWTLRPGIEGWFTGEGKAYVKINDAGWRDRQHTVAKPAGVYRVAVLGDSYSEAMHVSMEDTYWHLLEKKLTQCLAKPVEVMSFAVAGYGTAQQYLTLKDVALPYQPDLVLLQFTNGNDVRNNSRALEPEKERPFYTADFKLDRSFAQEKEFTNRRTFSSEAVRHLTDYSRTFQLVRTVSLMSRAHAANPNEVEAGLDVSPLSPPKTPQWDEAWRITERLIAETNSLARIHGAPLVLVMVPYAIQVHPDPQVRAKVPGADDFYPEKRLEAFGRSHGIPVVALAPEMQKLAQSEKRYLHGFESTKLGFGHWNPEGHRVAADLIARRLCAS